MLIVYLTAVMIRMSHCHGCFDTKFPRILGGILGNTKFFSFDIDVNKNIAIGGSTADGGVASL